MDGVHVSININNGDVMMFMPLHCIAIVIVSMYERKCKLQLLFSFGTSPYLYLLMVHRGITTHTNIIMG